MLRTAIFGSYLTDPGAAKDVDIILRADTATDLVDGLWKALNLADRLEKPVDIFINPASEGLCDCAWYDPHDSDRKLDTGVKMNFDQRFAGQGFFNGAKEIDLEAIQS